MVNREINKCHKNRINYFINEFLKHQGNSLALGVPDEMIIGNCNKAGWAQWKSIKSPVTEDDLCSIELEYSIQLPPLFKAYFMDRCILQTDFIVSLPKIPSNNPLSDLRSYLDMIKSDSFYRKNNYIPFGYDSNDAGPACFDVNSATKDDYAIVVLDHHSIAHNEKGDTINSWSSFSSLLDEIERDMIEQSKKSISDLDENIRRLLEL